MTVLQFYNTLSRFGMDALMKERGSVLTAFSGGADSSCLLVLLRDWCRDNGVALAAVHVNHMIRGEEADRDETFCRDRCRELGIPLTVRRADVPALAKERGLGLEECAREVRYACFDELAGKDGLIATAHNASDNLETVLFRMLRGTGLKGLCGIPPIRDGRYLRPLIRDGGEAVRSFCRENGIPYVTDRTNLEPGCARNILRMEALPALRTVFPDPEAAVSRMTELLRRDEELLEERAGALVPDGKAEISRAVFDGLAEAEASRVLRRMAEHAGGRVPEASHAEAVLTLSRGGSVGSVSLPGGVRCVLERDTVRVVRESRDPRAAAPEVLFGADYPGGILREDGFCRLICLPEDGEGPFPSIDIYSEENIYKSSTSVSLCFDKISFACRTRVRRPGDTIRFGGMTRRVKTLFSDRKLPPEVRSSLPVIEDGDGILWIPGFPPRDGTLWTGEGRRFTLVCQFTGTPPADRIVSS